MPWHLSAIPLLVPFLAEAQTGVDPTWAQYGLLGVAVMLLLGFARISYRRELGRADRLETELAQERQARERERERHYAEVTELREARQRERELWLPVLEAANTALRESSTVVRDIAMGRLHGDAYDRQPPQRSLGWPGGPAGGPTGSGHRDADYRSGGGAAGDPADQPGTGGDVR